MKTPFRSSIVISLMMLCAGCALRQDPSEAPDVFREASGFAEAVENGDLDQLALNWCEDPLKARGSLDSDPTFSIHGKERIGILKAFLDEAVIVPRGKEIISISNRNLILQRERSDIRVYDDRVRWENMEFRRSPDGKLKLFWIYTEASPPRQSR